jgi:hypothetical protein
MPVSHTGEDFTHQFSFGASDCLNKMVAQDELPAPNSISEGHRTPNPSPRPDDASSTYSQGLTAKGLVLTEAGVIPEGEGRTWLG